MRCSWCIEAGDPPAPVVEGGRFLFCAAHTAMVEVSEDDTDIRLTSKTAHLASEALVAIVGTPWARPDGQAARCPCCYWAIEMGVHADGCAWLTAARALGIA